MWLVNVYTPNSGEGLKRLDYRIQQWDKALAGYVKVRHSLHDPTTSLAYPTACHRVTSYTPWLLPHGAEPLNNSPNHCCQVAGVSE